MRNSETLSRMTNKQRSLLNMVRHCAVGMRGRDLTCWKEKERRNSLLDLSEEAIFDLDNVIES